MIAQFWYSVAPGEKHVAVRMSSDGDGPAGRVEIPGDIADRLAEMEISYVHGDMNLAFALGYGVTIAGLVGAALTITGDLSVWPESWGTLNPRPGVTSAPKVNPVH